MMTEPISIAFFMQDFSGGGVEKMRLILAQALATEGYVIFLVVAQLSGALARSVPPGVTFVNLQATGACSALRRLRVFVRTRRPDIVLSSLDHNNVVALLACIGAGRRTRVIICQHNALSEEAVLGWRYRIIPVLYWLLQWRAAGIVAISMGVADDLARTARLPKHRITVVANPVVDVSRLPVQSAPPPHAWFSERDRPVFIFVGRLVPQKDPLFLLAAFGKRLTQDRARLIVLGEGPLLRPMQDFITSSGMIDHVLMAGYVVNPLPWIAQADALLLTSRYEGFGNVLAEALACGTPVIATDCPHGPAEVLERGRYGHLIAPGDVEGYARAMQGDLRTQFPSAFLRDRGLLYTLDRSVKAHMALIDAVLRSRQRNVFGIRLSTSGVPQIVQRVLADPSGKVRCVITPNLNHIRLLRRRDFLEACRHADLICPDGWPVALYGRLRGAAGLGRVTGCDITHALLHAPEVKKKKIMVVAEACATKIALLQWLETQSWTEPWEIFVAPLNLSQDAVAQGVLAARIGNVKPDILLMTLGAPVSELFVHTHRAVLPPLWALCTGQALRVVLGLTRRAPIIWRILGLEWAWRCVQEPRRLGIRYVKDAAWFPCAVMRDLAGGREI